MTYNPYHQDPNELALLQGATIQRTGVSQEGFPYLLVEKQGKTFYLFVQSKEAHRLLMAAQHQAALALEILRSL